MKSNELKLNPDKTFYWTKLHRKELYETIPRKIIRSWNNTNRLSSKSWIRVRQKHIYISLVFAAAMSAHWIYPMHIAISVLLIYTPLWSTWGWNTLHWKSCSKRALNSHYNQRLLSSTHFVHIAYINYILYLPICYLMLCYLIEYHKSELTRAIVICNVFQWIVGDTLIILLDLTCYCKAPSSNHCTSISGSRSQHCQPVPPPVDKLPIEKTGEAPVWCLQTLINLWRRKSVWPPPLVGF